MTTVDMLLAYSAPVACTTTDRTLYEASAATSTWQHALFVGRQHELKCWRNAITGSGVSVFYLYGPGGIGKTSLLYAFAAEARCRAIATTPIDTRDLEPTLRVTAALDGAGLSATSGDPNGSQRVVLVDTYEHRWPIEPLVRFELLRRVQGTTLLVIAGRLPPSAEWRALSLWGSMIMLIALPNLAPPEATEHLARRGSEARRPRRSSRFRMAIPWHSRSPPKRSGTRRRRLFRPAAHPMSSQRCTTILHAACPSRSSAQRWRWRLSCTNLGDDARRAAGVRRAALDDWGEPAPSRSDSPSLPALSKDEFGRRVREGSTGARRH
jgi:hypothetical protein